MWPVCASLLAADRARTRSAAGVAGFHIRLSLCMFECLCACLLLVRLTHAILFSCNVHAERPHEGGGSCYPGALLFLWRAQTGLRAPCGRGLRSPSPPKLLVCMDFANSWTRREEEVTPTA